MNFTIYTIRGTG